MKPQKPRYLYKLLLGFASSCCFWFWVGLLGEWACRGQTIEFCNEVGKVKGSERGISQEGGGKMGKR